MYVQAYYNTIILYLSNRQKGEGGKYDYIYGGRRHQTNHRPDGPSVCQTALFATEAGAENTAGINEGWQHIIYFCRGGRRGSFADSVIRIHRVSLLVDAKKKKK